MKFIANCCLLLSLSCLSIISLADEPIDFSAKIRAIEPSHAQVNDVDIAYKVLGNREDPAVLLIMGLGSSHILWGDAIPNQLVKAGYQVVLFDNRDVGDSQRLVEHGKPTIWWEVIKGRLGFEMKAPYDLSDMAADTLGLMDVMQIDKAHIVGASMGGMIAQVLAAQYPNRILSLTSIMSTPGFADHLPPPGEMSGSFTEPSENETEAEAKLRLEKFGFYLDSIPRQLMAIIKSGDRSEQVKTITAPTLVMHGNEDTLIPVAHGQYTSELIKGSKFVAFDGMGHNLPPAVLPALMGEMVSHMKQHDALTSHALAVGQ